MEIGSFLKQAAYPMRPTRSVVRVGSAEPPGTHQKAAGRRENHAATKPVAEHVTHFRADGRQVRRVKLNVPAMNPSETGGNLNCEEAAMNRILVTGRSGFIGSHVILQFLAAGHQVRTSMRSLKRERDVRAMLREGGAEPGDRLSFFAADLENDAGWLEATAGCEYLLHVASPLPPNLPKDENELIAPAREGTVRVLRATPE
jgi:NAD-dependent epimerase/dehydratase family protein